MSDTITDQDVQKRVSDIQTLLGRGINASNRAPFDLPTDETTYRAFIELADSGREYYDFTVYEAKGLVDAED